MKKLFLTLLTVLLVIPSAALAFELQTGDEIYITETVNDDTYAAGGIVQVEADINGDLVIGGGQVTVNGNVSQDLTIGGGDIYVAGEIGDDVRIGGGNVRIVGIVKDDLFVGGGNVDLAESSFIGGDVVVGAGNLNINGDVQGSVIAGLGSIFINSKIAGNVVLHNADKIKFGPKGQVLGDLWYKGSKKHKFKEGQVLGEVSYDPSRRPEFKELEQRLPGFFAALVAGFHIYKLLSLLFFGLFLLWIYRYFALHVSEHAFESPLKDLGVGLILLLLGPVISILFMITIIGIPLGLVTLATWMVLVYVGKIMAAAMIGAKIVRVNQKSSFLRMYGSFATGALIFVLLNLIPVVGWLIKFFLVLIALGATGLYFMELSESLRKKKLA